MAYILGRVCRERRSVDRRVNTAAFEGRIDRRVSRESIATVIGCDSSRPCEDQSEGCVDVGKYSQDLTADNRRSPQSPLWSM